jgi:superfamily II DNA/RNA helicase
MTASPADAPLDAASFASLPLATAMLANLERLGYERMTPVQAASLPLALAGRDLIVQAKTGSGKTAAFALPPLARLEPRRLAVQALVLCPTRELAAQIVERGAWGINPRGEVVAAFNLSGQVQRSSAEEMAARFLPGMRQLQALLRPLVS